MQNQTARRLDNKFQSTPSARRATVVDTKSSATNEDFNPRPPRGERHFDEDTGHFESIISIHALREESDINLL